MLQVRSLRPDGGPGSNCYLLLGSDLTPRLRHARCTCNPNQQVATETIQDGSREHVLGELTRCLGRQETSKPPLQARKALHRLRLAEALGVPILLRDVLQHLCHQLRHIGNHRQWVRQLGNGPDAAAERRVGRQQGPPEEAGPGQAVGRLTATCSTAAPCRSLRPEAAAQPQRRRRAGVEAGTGARGPGGSRPEVRRHRLRAGDPRQLARGPDLRQLGGGDRRPSEHGGLRLRVLALQPQLRQVAGNRGERHRAARLLQHRLVYAQRLLQVAQWAAQGPWRPLAPQHPLRQLHRRRRRRLARRRRCRCRSAGDPGRELRRRRQRRQRRRTRRRQRFVVAAREGFAVGRGELPEVRHPRHLCCALVGWATSEAKC
mmetsp:Transcript_88615/g.286194  ORF Transcript_88615/g.286194 Transcript_88615/m.286194 type:complete len:374 (+) Transcript_88615:1360-2481(+)